MAGQVVVAGFVLVTPVTSDEQHQPGASFSVLNSKGNGGGSNPVKPSPIPGGDDDMARQFGQKRGIDLVP